MTKVPAITVAITTYNLEKYLVRCFAELAAQTVQDFEILVYDDCSSDLTRDILALKKEQLGDKLQIILGNVPQKLPAKARNIVLNSGKIHGKYIIFLDGDDSIEPDFLEQLYLAAEQTGADLSLCAYDRFEDETGHVLCEEMRGFPKLITLGAKDAPSLAFVNTSLWNKLIRTEVIGTLRLPEFSVGEDASFLQAIYMNCHQIACVDRILIHYRVRSASVISNTPEESIYSFAAELYRLWQQAENTWMKDNIALTAFIHIGISMPLRAYDNPRIQISHLLCWVRRYFADNFQNFRGNRYLKLSFLIRLGIKGIGMYGALVCHKLHCFRLFLWAYKMITHYLRIDIKF